ncbi:MAG TPA: amidohydrolase family protein, partial [Acetobacteraceae bacterium]|nr:amidohydrolase family protein [Acetobacteraceae bacterium]
MTQWIVRADSVFLDPPGQSIPGLVVLVRDRTIAFVGAEGDARSAVDPGAFRVLDLSGLRLFPGLMNTHVHLSFNGTTDVLARYLAEPPGTRVIRAVVNAQTMLRSGVTTARDCGSDALVMTALAGAIAADLVPLPNLLLCGPPLTQTGGHLHHMGGEADGADAIRRLVRLLHKQGATSIKAMATGGQMTPGTKPEYPAFTQNELDTMVEAARELGLPTVSHCLSAEGTRRSARAGFDSIEHCAFFEREEHGWLERVYRQGITDEIRASGAAVMMGLSANHHGLDAARAGRDVGERERFLLAQSQRMLRIFRDMAEQGVPMIAGTDAGVVNTPFDETWLELALMAQAGLSPLEALRSATIRAAKAMRIDHLTGAIRAGLRADLIAVAG